MFQSIASKTIKQMVNKQDKIIEIIKELVDAPSDIDESYKIGSNSGWDSLSIVRLIVALENKLNIILKLDFFTEDKTILEILEIDNEK